MKIPSYKSTMAAIKSDPKLIYITVILVFARQEIEKGNKKEAMNLIDLILPDLPGFPGREELEQIAAQIRLMTDALESESTPKEQKH